MKTGKSDPLLVDFRVWLSSYGEMVVESLRQDLRHTKNGPRGELICKVCKAERDLVHLIQMLGDQGGPPPGFKDDRCATCGHDRLSHSLQDEAANLSMCKECQVNRRCVEFVAIEVQNELGVG